MTDATIDHAEVLVTLPECPGWCAAQCPGGFDDNWRHHELVVGHVEGVPAEKLTADGSAEVALVQDEKIVGRELLREPVELTLTMGGNDTVALTPAAARSLAEALVSAADAFEDVTQP